MRPESSPSAGASAAHACLPRLLSALQQKAGEDGASPNDNGCPRHVRPHALAAAIARLSRDIEQRRIRRRVCRDLGVALVAVTVGRFRWLLKRQDTPLDIGAGKCRRPRDLGRASIWSVAVAGFEARVARAGGCCSAGKVALNVCDARGRSC